MLAEKSVPQPRRERDWDRGPCGVGEPGLLRPPQQDLPYCGHLAEHRPELAAQRRAMAGVAALSGAWSVMPQFQPVGGRPPLWHPSPNTREARFVIHPAVMLLSQAATVLGFPLSHAAPARAATGAPRPLHRPA
jgi:hypothetical protein